MMMSYNLRTLNAVFLFVILFVLITIVSFISYIEWMGYSWQFKNQIKIIKINNSRGGNISASFIEIFKSKILRTRYDVDCKLILKLNDV